MTPVLFRLAQRYVGRRLLQSILFVLGVALGVAMLIAIDVANASASRAFQLSTESITGKATHQIIGGPGGLPSETYQQLRSDLGLRVSAPVIEDYVRATAFGDQADDRVLHLLGVDPFVEAPFRAYLSNIDVDGAPADASVIFAQFIAQPNSVVISASLAGRAALEIGDTLEIHGNNGRTTAHIIGILEPQDDLSRDALDNLLMTDIATAQELVGMAGKISRIDLILPDDADLSLIEAQLPEGASILSPQEQNSALQQMTAAFELNLQALSLLALVVGVFLIYNTVTFSVVQRRPQLGILRAIGTTRGQIFTIVLGEALLLGTIGTILGLGLGIVFGRGAVGLVSQTISDLYFTVNVQNITVTPIILLKGTVIGIASSMIAALIPSYDATRTPPAGALRRSDVERNTSKMIPYITLGALGLLALGALLSRLPSPSIIIGFASLFCIIVGGAFFTPIVLIAVMRIATPIMHRLFGVLGRLAPRGVERSLSRTSVAVAALTVAVSVIVGVSVMISSFRMTVDEWLHTTLGADIYISPPNVLSNRATSNIDPAIVETIAAVDGVAQVAHVREVTVTAPDFPEMPPANLLAGSTDVAAAVRRFTWLTVPQESYWETLDSGAIMVSEPFAYRRNITPENNTIRLQTDRGIQTFEVIGVFYDYSSDQGTIFMSYDVYAAHYDDAYISSISVNAAPDTSPDALLETLRSQTLTGTDLIAQSNSSLRSGVFEVFDRAFSITIALRLLATLVAFIGILSALMALQLEQTRQFGTMRAIGLTGRQLYSLTLMQTGLMGFVAGVLALPIGYILAVVLIAVINVRSFGWTMQLALLPQELLLAFVVAIVAALAAGLYPAHRLSRLVTARALRSE